MVRLYYSVDFEVPQSISSRKSGMSAFRSPVTQSVRELKIRNGMGDRRNSIYSRRRKSDAGSVDAYVAEILNKVPANRLTRFA